MSFSGGTVGLALGDASGTVLLDLDDDVTIRTALFNPGSPATRAVVIDRPTAPGTIDTTKYHSARAVTWNGVGAGPNFPLFMDTLRGLHNPANRLYLYCTNPLWPQQRRILVRPADLNAQWDADWLVTASWVGVDGVFESAVLSQASLAATATGAYTVASGTLIQAGVTVSGAPKAGVTFPLTFPLTFTGAEAAGITTVVNNGKTLSPPTFIITGPCTAPKITCVTTAEMLSWPGLTLAEGETLVVDVQETSALLGGDSTAWVNTDWSVSTWPWIPLGMSLWKCTTLTSGAGFGALMNWRDRWL